MNISIFATFLSSLSLMFFSSPGLSFQLQDFTNRPKLVVYVIVDQLRADQMSLGKFRSSKANASDMGFDFLMRQGAYFPFTKYLLLQAMTCPGHATIATGSWPASHGIVINDWYDRQSRSQLYCVDDEKFGVSPRKLLTNTFVDEVDLAGIRGNLVSVSLKDRAAVMLGGLRAKKVFWIDTKEPSWTTSSYYQTTPLPKWVKDYKIKTPASSDIEELMPAAWGTEATTDFALQAIKSENLGKSGKTDFLMISYSSHDMTGHRFGPDSEELKQVFQAENQQVSRLMAGIKSHLGSLDSVAVVVSSDHGVSPVIPVDERTQGMAGKISESEMLKKLNAHLSEYFHQKAGTHWIDKYLLLHFYFDKKTISENRLNFDDVVKQAKSFLLSLEGIDNAVITNEKSPAYPARMQTQITNSVLTERSGDLIVLPKPFFTVSEKALANHVTGYAYDSTVPLILWGRWFKPGVYLSNAQVVDIASTMSAILGVLPPAKADGRILNEAIR